MKGDISRDTFDRARHYRSVRLQQGRVVTDADWNEQADLTRYRAETQAHDVIGSCGAPMHAAGLEVAAATYALSVFAEAAGPRAWVVGEDGVLLRTLDGGATWTLVDTGTTVHLRSVRFTGNTGWIVGDRGTVLKSTNGGATWSPQDAGVTSRLRGLAVLDANHACAVGDGGVVVRTDDGGATKWKDQGVGGMRLNAVDYADANVVVAVGSEGAIARSPDGAKTWASVSSGTDAHLRGVDFADATKGWAAGDDGEILHTTDAGQSWTAQSSTVSDDFHGVAFRDAQAGWAVGADGAAAQTTDGGATWTAVNLGTAETLHGLSVPAGQTGWAVGEASVAVSLGLGSPAVVAQVLPAMNLSILPGRFYAKGMLCELDERAPYHNQPDRGRTPRLAAGKHLVYLDAWARHLSYLDAPGIREVALGGPDTATRGRTLCQVKTLPLPTTSPDDWNCLSALAAWDALTAPSAARLKARSEPVATTSGVCEIAATAGYRRLENQLYRIEVHESGGAPTFKWSRENGSVAYAIESITPDTVNNQTVVRLAARGRDANLDLAVHDRVEIVDADAVLEDRAGMIVEYLKDGDDPREIVLDGIIGAGIGDDPSRYPQLRRWEQKPSVGDTLPLDEGKWIDLEDGVQVWFESGGTYRPGDYWQVPGRTFTGDVEWPLDDDGDPVARAPAGIEDRYCRLAIIEVKPNDGSVEVISDCRPIFPPLTELDQLLYVSGDGQDGPPGEELPQPLQVRVARGEHPVANATVRFKIPSGSGNGSLVGAPGGVELEVDTDGAGIASCKWVLDADPAASARYQRVEAVLLDAAGQPVPGQVVIFAATSTVSLLYVSGDGQQGPPSQQLVHDLEVRTANGQLPVKGMKVRFQVVQGGGSIQGTNPVTTPATGLATVHWRLGASGAQRVEARLLDSGNAVVQHVGFNATIVTQKDGAGCALTIGEGGDLEKLDTQILKELLEKFGGRLCLCFLPGDHAIEDLQVDGGGQGRLTMHGCGHAAVLRLARRVELLNFATLEISDLAVEAEPESGILLRENQEAIVANIVARMPPSERVAVLTLIANRKTTVRDCVINAQGKGLGVVFEDALTAVQFHGNQVSGVVSFYGVPGKIDDLDQIDFKPLGVRLKNPPALEVGSTDVFLARNQITWLTIGRRKIKELVELVTGNVDVVRGLHRTFKLTDNVLSRDKNIVLGGFVTWDTTLFNQFRQGMALGAAVGRSTQALGNDAAVVLEDAPFFLVLAMERNVGPATVNHLRRANFVPIQVP